MSDAVYYPFDWWQFFSHRARLRRKQLSLSVTKMKQPVPYARLLYSTAFAWLLVNFAVFFANWILPDLILGNGGWIFLIYLGISISWILVCMFYAWVQAHWPFTVKWQIGYCYPVSVRSFKPGQKIDSILLAENDGPNAKRSELFVELAIGNGVDDLPFPKSKGPVMVGLAQFTDAKGRLRAGRLQGPSYFVPCTPKFYVLGDLDNWRGVDWAKKIRHHFGDLVSDFTRVILALDPIDPETWDPGSETPALEKELFESRQRVHQLEVDLGDYTMEDRIRKGSQEDEYL